MKSTLYFFTVASPEPTMTYSIKQYARHLRSYYEKHLLLPSYCKLFSFTSNMFVDLSIIKLDPDDTSQAIIQCVLDDNIENKTQISFKDLCLIPHGSSLLIEGAPGIGKSTLAFALCYHWVSVVALNTIDDPEGTVDPDSEDDPNIMALQHYSLLFLFQLGDESVQKALSSVRDLLGLFSCHKSWQQQANQDIIDNDGRGVMIILEGYDELLNQHTKLIFDEIKQCISRATIIVTCRPSFKSHLRQIIQFRYHIGIVGFTKSSRAEYICKFFKGDEALHKKFLQYLKRFPKIEGCLYVPINLVIILEIFHSFINDDDSCPPETTTELYDTLVRMLTYRHLKGLDKIKDINISSLKALTQPTLSAFTNLCKVAYDNIGNKKICQPESFETLGLMQKESQMLPSEGGDVFVYNFLHSTIQEFLAAYHIHDKQDEVVQVFRSNEPKLSNLMRFLAGLTKLESIHLQIPEKVYSSNIFHQLFEARDDVLASKLLGEKEIMEVCHFRSVPIPSDMYVIGCSIALGKCRWRLGFTFRSITSEHMEMFVSGLLSKVEVKGQIENLSFSLNPLHNNGLSTFFKLPNCILSNLRYLNLRGVEIDAGCLHDLVLATPKLVNLSKFLFHDNNFKEGEQRHFIETLSLSKSLEHVSFSTLSPDEGMTLLTSSHTLHTIELYQLSPPSIETVIKYLSSSKGLKTLQIHQSEVKDDLVTYLPISLPSSHLKSLEFINCAIDSVIVCIIADAVMRTPSLEKLNLSDNLIDDEGGHYLADILQSMIVAVSSKQHPSSNDMYLYIDYNPFSETTVSSLIDKLSSYDEQSLKIKLHLSLGWEDFVKSHHNYRRVQKYLQFGRN